MAARITLRAQEEPALADGVLHWQSNVLSFAGEWQADAVAVRETVYQSDEGSIDWHCLMPRARARLWQRAAGGSDEHARGRRPRSGDAERAGDGSRERTGFGYAERLTMTVAPWKLPIRTLRWGRFLSASDWVVWIDWVQETPVQETLVHATSRRFVYRNGKPVRAMSLEDDSMEFEDGSRLRFDRSLVLREGRLGATALSAVPGIRKTFPGRLLEVDECKWRSRARLERPDGPAAEGWAIHERVTWPQ